MMKTIKLAFKVIFGRTMIVGLLLLLQIYILFGVFQYFGEYGQYFYGGFTLLAGIVIVYIINKDENPVFKLAWILPVCILPVLGALFYLFIELNPGIFGIKKKLEKRVLESKEFLKTEKSLQIKMKQEDTDLKQMSFYLEKMGGHGTYENTEITYFPLGELKFKALLEDLNKAEKFIFLEYFIIEKGVMWNSILEILKIKVSQGVEVRLMYDGMCSLVLLPYHYPKELSKFGIKAKMFSPIKPALSTHQNNRDHRKIVVIDGKIAYNGGVNLADEYINEKVVYGHWKDVAIRLEGDAVKSFTGMFLQMWNISEKGEEDYKKYLNVQNLSIKNIGYVIPYGDGPDTKEPIAENVYIDILYNAKEYVYIMTPYLIIDNEMVRALLYAANRGIDVRIILPHIPDKKTVFAVAKTFYPQLIQGGVKIYEYLPGFIHAKTFVSDGEKAVVGTINLDYRSLYLHFECATYLYHHSVIVDIEKDFIDTLEVSQMIKMEDYKKVNVFMRCTGRILRLIAPLM